jgi:hypothetical protein
LFPPFFGEKCSPVKSTKTKRKLRSFFKNHFFVFNFASTPKKIDAHAPLLLLVLLLLLLLLLLLCAAAASVAAAAVGGHHTASKQQSACGLMYTTHILTLKRLSCHQGLTLPSAHTTRRCCPPLPHRPVAHILKP